MRTVKRQALMVTEGDRQTQGEDRQRQSNSTGRQIDGADQGDRSCGQTDLGHRQITRERGRQKFQTSIIFSRQNCTHMLVILFLILQAVSLIQTTIIAKTKKNMKR